jgi:DNA polymerase III delta subunit
MIVVKMNGELEEKLNTIVLIEGEDRERVIERLREIAKEAVRQEIERRYRELVSASV